MDGSARVGREERMKVRVRLSYCQLLRMFVGEKLMGCHTGWSGRCMLPRGSDVGS